jgi:hypothetical protein
MCTIVATNYMDSDITTQKNKSPDSTVAVWRHYNCAEISLLGRFLEAGCVTSLFHCCELVPRVFTGPLPSKALAIYLGEQCKLLIPGISEVKMWPVAIIGERNCLNLPLFMDTSIILKLSVH